MTKPMITGLSRWIARPRWIKSQEEQIPSYEGVESTSTQPEQVFVYFVVRFPAAERVRLIASFTGWEKHPIELDRSHNGTWFTTVPLAPGRYEYAYLVDDCWQLDEESEQVVNRFGPRVNQCVV